MITIGVPPTMKQVAVHTLVGGVMVGCMACASQALALQLFCWVIGPIKPGASALLCFADSLPVKRQEQTVTLKESLQDIGPWALACQVSQLSQH